MLRKINLPLFDLTAVLAALVFSYYFYLGKSFILCANNAEAMLLSLGVFLLISVLAIALKRIKGIKGHFRLAINLERILLLATLAFIVFVFTTFSHYFYVKDQRQIISSVFINNVQQARAVYTDYDAAVQNRLDIYESALTLAIKYYETGINLDPFLNTYRFNPVGVDNSQQKLNKIQVMRNKLYPANINQFKEQDSLWMNEAEKVAKDWTPLLLLDKVQSIEARMNNRAAQLENVYEYRAQGEEIANPNIKDPIRDINFKSLTARFQTQGTPTILAVVFGCILILFMLIPYLIQERNSKNEYSLFPKLIKHSRRDKNIDIN
jgi:hypothetical protein